MIGGTRLDLLDYPGEGFCRGFVQSGKSRVGMFQILSHTIVTFLLFTYLPCRYPT